MRIERIVTNVKTLGPGNRLCIWVNGCKRGCKGCVSKELQPVMLETEGKIEDFLEGFNLKKVDGVTISGGEPFEQIDELKKLINILVDEKIKDILVYTGYTLEELLVMENENVSFILNNISVLIDGPYILELDDQKNNLKGSKNQKIHYLKIEYKQIYDDYITNTRSMQEFEMANILLGVGIPTKEYIEDFKK